MTNQVHLKFDAKSVNEGFARMAVMAFMADMNPTMDELEDVKTAVSEAVTNAIIHGYNDETKQVEMSCKREENELIVTVIDYGVGNLFSLTASLKSLGADVVVTNKKEEIKKENQTAEPKKDAKNDSAEEETDTEELFNLQRSLAAIHNIVNFLHRCQDEENTIPVYPYLYALTTDVKTYPQIVRRIDQILDKYGQVKDTASPTLLMIRRELAATAGSVSRVLQNILKAAKGEGLIDKDVSPTLRDGRLVIPVAPAMKRKIRGIVHDESDTGRTIFIEPAEVVETNNKIRELESEERKEIHRILMEFTQIVRPEVSDMLFSYAFLAQIDFIRAKAKFAIITNSTEPRMENKQILDWSLAIHPLLDLKFRDYNTQHPDEEPRKVVPLDILLTSKQRLLLISGPNAGGKSVCLKTTGLLQYMFQCGMPVPAAPSSIFGIFRSIFIDIGDEQSLENDLSTYSSHLLNMKYMMKMEQWWL